MTGVAAEYLNNGSKDPLAKDCYLMSEKAAVFSSSFLLSFVSICRFILSWFSSSRQGVICVLPVGDDFQFIGSVFLAVIFIILFHLCLSHSSSCFISYVSSFYVTLLFSSPRAWRRFMLPVPHLLAADALPPRLPFVICLPVPPAAGEALLGWGCTVNQGVVLVLFSGSFIIAINRAS